MSKNVSKFTTFKYIFFGKHFKYQKNVSNILFLLTTGYVNRVIEI